jgi:predicted CXXCH cytochrome family protein
MLPAIGDKLCASCHEDVATLATTAISQHGAISDGGCAVCHDPHGTGQVKMLLQAQGPLCLDCHDGIKAKIANAKSQHQPVKDGECVACHNPHGAAFKPLLAREVPLGFYFPYQEEHYSLCFGCHERGITAFIRTIKTNFRNGDYNLHSLHVNKSEKGRTCRVCHGVHGADQERLVQSSSPSFGRWAIPIYLKVTESGGTCVVGCHKPKSYDRYRPVNNP